MRKKKGKARHWKTSAQLGNEMCGLWPYIAALTTNALMHTGLFMLTDGSVYSFIRLLISYIFFIYPYYFVADVFWSLRPDVSAILAREVKINRKYYTNCVRTDIPKESLLPATVSIPVYLEENAVIFETVRQSRAAVEHYRRVSGKQVNVLVSDDGLAPMLGGFLTRTKVEELLRRYEENPGQLGENEIKAAERIRYYRENGIGFVARPAKNRAGLFKKASNLNFTLRLGKRLAAGRSLQVLCAKGGEFEFGYAEGGVITHDIILLLDKDSGVNEKIMEAVVPEFVADGMLAYVQCSTNAANLTESYYTKAVGYNINNLFHNIWPCKALQGYFVPLVGHNVFLRRSMLEESGYWSENKVSEDYDKAISFYNIGYHGKYAHFEGLEFSEYVSRTFSEETGKQQRYSYGLLEMLLQGTIRIGKTRGCDVLYMFLYFCSLVNAVMLLPAALLECYIGNIHLLWAGFIFCNICFIVLPCFRGLIMRNRIPGEQRGNLGTASILALSFLGHAYSMLAGICKYFLNKFRRNPKAFPSTNVDTLQYRFVDGVGLLKAYVMKNKGLLPVAALCIERGLFIMANVHAQLPTLLTYGYILFVSVLVPVIMTPQLFRQPSEMLKKAFRVLRRKPKAGPAKS